MDHARPETTRLHARPVAVPPVADLLIGRSAQEGAELLPRLFNLCRHAQGVAARAAFGLPLGDDYVEGLRREAFKENIVKLCIKWPGFFGDQPMCLPAGWNEARDNIRSTLFGDTECLAQTWDGYCAFLESGQGVAATLSKIKDVFAPGEATSDTLPGATPESMFKDTAQENSVAARHIAHPIMRAVEARYGRGPFWHATAVLYDAESCLNGHLPAPHFAKGKAVVPAARGLYGISATLDGNTITQFRRITPTDHLLAPKGALSTALKSLPVAKCQALAPLVLSILDPCTPVRLEQATRREMCDA